MKTLTLSPFADASPATRRSASRRASPPRRPASPPRRLSEASRGAARTRLRLAAGGASVGGLVLPLRAMAAHSFPDGQHGNALVGGVAARRAVQPRHADPAALVVERDHLPQPGVEHRAARAAALGRRAVVHAAHARDLRPAFG